MTEASRSRARTVGQRAQRTRKVAARVPFMLERIDHVLLIVKGLERALAFYRDVLGCRIVASLPQYGMIELRAGGSMIDLVDIGGREGAWARPDVAGGRNLDHLCLAISGASEQTLRTHLAAHAIEIVEEDAREDGLSLYVRDPSGNTIELKSPPRTSRRV